jgi:hypothetical protein
MCVCQSVEMTGASSRRDSQFSSCLCSRSFELVVFHSRTKGEDPETERHAQPGCSGREQEKHSLLTKQGNFATNHVLVDFRRQIIKNRGKRLVPLQDTKPRDRELEGREKRTLSSEYF